MLRILPLLLLLILSPVAAASAGEIDGNELLTRCQTVVRLMDDPDTEGDDFGAAYCVGYIDAAFEFSVYHEESKRRREICWPKVELTTGQLVRVVVKYLKENPADLHEAPLLLTLRAFEEAFPCR